MRITFSLLSIYLIIIAEAQVRMDEILSYPIADDEMGLVLEREEYLSTHKFNSPWLRELEFRIRPNNLETSLSDYRLRFGILNPAEIRANRDYHRLLIRQQSFERVKTINSVLKRRYELILEGHYLSQRLSINEENLDRLKEIRSVVVGEDISIGDLIKLEEDITKQELGINEIIRNINQLKVAYQNFGLESISSFPEDDWISKEQIAEIVAQTVDDETLNLIATRQDLNKEESILRINKAEAFSNLGFFQAEYDDERGDTRDEQVRFQVGIQIPIFNTDRPDNQRRELEIIEEKEEYNALRIEEKDERKVQLIELTDYLEEWRILEEKEEVLLNFQKSIEELGGDVAAYDRLRSYSYFLDERKLRVKMDVYIGYINQLADSGRLADLPYHNFLVSGLDSFDLNNTD